MPAHTSAFRLPRHLVVHGIAVISLAQAANYPVHVSSDALASPPYRSTDVLFSEIGLSSFRGSAVHLPRTRLLYT